MSGEENSPFEAVLRQVCAQHAQALETELAGLCEALGDAETAQLSLAVHELIHTLRNIP